LDGLLIIVIFLYEVVKGVQVHIVAHTASLYTLYIISLEVQNFFPNKKDNDKVSNLHQDHLL
jgi:hypothetical protein